MVLSGDEIRKRLTGDPPDIFIPDSWVEDGFKEASYALRVADDELMIDGKFYESDEPFRETYIQIKPGSIAVLSTKEELMMPDNLVGKIGIRLEYALKGLTGLMGIQVDPCYGRQRDGERLYIRVANLGNEPIKILPGDPVFTFELHEVEGLVDCSKFPKRRTWEVLKAGLKDQNNASWSYATRINDDSVRTARRLRSEANRREDTHQRNFELEIGRIRDYIQPVVMFGIFLVAVTILGVSLTTILGVRDIPSSTVPPWMTDSGWKLILATLVIAAIGTTSVAVLTCAQLVLVICGNRRRRRPGTDST